MDISRKHDLKVIETGLKSKNPVERDQAGKAAEKIRKENLDGWTREARQRLVTESIKGNKGNAWDIRDEMIKRRGGRQDRGQMVTSATFHWPEGLYEKIFGHN